MKFLVGKSKKEALRVAQFDLLWTRTAEFKLLDLNRDDVMVISKASEMRGHNVECVFLLPDFDDMDGLRWAEFQSVFETRKTKTMRL